jgi:hypothetical protein
MSMSSGLSLLCAVVRPLPFEVVVVVVVVVRVEVCVG